MKDKTSTLVVYTDGGARGNPGPAGAGVVILDGHGEEIHAASLPLGERTNNEAEYEAVIFGLTELRRLFSQEEAATLRVEVRLDSELIARQLRGEYKVKEVRLRTLVEKVFAKKKFFRAVLFCEIPRAENVRADALANEAMDRLLAP